MTVANPRRYTLADAIRDEFERRHPRGKDTLLCVGLCRRRKDRLEFRETPWHGRVASCMSCEGDQWRKALDARTWWELEQAREKLRTYQRYAGYLKLRLLVRDIPKSTDIVVAYFRPFEGAVARKARALAPSIEAVGRLVTGPSSDEETR